MALLATNSVHLHRQTHVVGDVVVNDASAGPTLKAGFELAVDRSSTIDGDAKGDSVSLARDSEVTGGVHYNSLQDDDARIGSLHTPLDLPVFELLPPFHTAFLRPGAADVSVASGQTLTLAAGDYDDIQIAAGGTLVFSGGVYNARSLHSDRRRRALLRGRHRPAHRRAARPRHRRRGHRGGRAPG